MKAVRDQVQETAKRIKRLGESSQEIGEIVELIGDIADRTSILALNASIQAAMAGEAGRGFAIVADEVERLADRATEATKRAGILVKTTQTETAEVMAAMEDTTREVINRSNIANEAGVALSEIQSVSNRLAELIQAISDAAQQQARGSEQVAKSMNEMSSVTRNTAASTKQTAAAINSLGAAGRQPQRHGVAVQAAGDWRATTPSREPRQPAAARGIADRRTHAVRRKPTLRTDGQVCVRHFVRRANERGDTERRRCRRAAALVRAHSAPLRPRVPERAAARRDAAIVREQAKARGVSNEAAYYQLLSKPARAAASEWDALVERLLNHETSFFRHPPSFDALQRHILPELRDARPRGGELNLWSAGCSTGQEAYSLAMVAMDDEALNGEFTVWGGDISRYAIDIARRGRYGPRAVATVSRPTIDSGSCAPSNERGRRVRNRRRAASARPVHGGKPRRDRHLQRRATTSSSATTS